MADPFATAAEVEWHPGWREFDYHDLARVIRQIDGGSEWDAAEAVHDVICTLIEKRAEVFARDPRSILGLISTYASHRLMQLRARNRGGGRALSLDLIMETEGTEDSPLDSAMPAVAHGRVGVDEDARFTPPPTPGEAWNRSQVIGAAQRFRDQYGRSPRSGEFCADHGLPKLPVVRRLGFADLRDLFLEAGLPVEFTPRTRQRWGPVEAAEACYAFRRREGYWPGAGDIGTVPTGTLPSYAAMARYFGGSSPGQVQVGVEAILGPIDRRG